MPHAPCQTTTPRYRSLFPDWSGPQPFGFFLMENLLEARRQSEFPTNIGGNDEDVNVYLCHLLTNHLGSRNDLDLDLGAGPTLLPPDRTCDRRSAAEFYRRHGDQRLFFQGIFKRGDGVRRRSVPWGLTAAESWQRDLVTGRQCYALAANVLAGRGRATSPLAPVLAKLAANYERYVHVLATLATRRLDLGAKLKDSDLQSLWIRPPVPTTTQNVVGQPTVDMDDLLDAVDAYNRTPTPQAHARMLELGAQLGVADAQLPRRAGFGEG